MLTSLVQLGAGLPVPPTLPEKVLGTPELPGRRNSIPENRVWVSQEHPVRHLEWWGIGSLGVRSCRAAPCLSVPARCHLCMLTAGQGTHPCLVSSMPGIFYVQVNMEVGESVGLMFAWGILQTRAGVLHEPDLALLRIRQVLSVQSLPSPSFTLKMRTSG